ncbi:MAG TPA: hypothetical protein DCG47_07005 [Spirochaetaceae bacterium]|nr:hypothetical protein [Spirochaetaceae bacterium]
MELYTLHLQKALRYERLCVPSLDALLGRMGESGEGSESLAFWDIDTLALEGDDGPTLREPLPAPLWAGSASTALEATALPLSAGINSPLEATQDTGIYTLDKGRYLFCQARAASAADLRDQLEWFVREGWWSGTPIRHRIYLRLVREDGKTAAQVLARNTQL